MARDDEVVLTLKVEGDPRAQVEALRRKAQETANAKPIKQRVVFAGSQPINPEAESRRPAGRYGDNTTWQQPSTRGWGPPLQHGPRYGQSGPPAYNPNMDLNSHPRLTDPVGGRGDPAQPWNNLFPQARATNPGQGTFQVGKQGQAYDEFGKNLYQMKDVNFQLGKFGRFVSLLGGAGKASGMVAPGASGGAAAGLFVMALLEKLKQVAEWMTSKLKMVLAYANQTIAVASPRHAATENLSEKLLEASIGSSFLGYSNLKSSLYQRGAGAADYAGNAMIAAHEASPSWLRRTRNYLAGEPPLTSFEGLPQSETHTSMADWHAKMQTEALSMGPLERAIFQKQMANATGVDTPEQAAARKMGEDIGKIVDILGLLVGKIPEGWR